MRNYELKEKEAPILTKIVCNCCESVIPQASDGVWEEYFHGEKEWGYLSHKDGQTEVFDLCQDCYEKMLSTFRIPLNKTGD